MPAQGPAHGPGVTHAQVAAVESVPHREEARPFTGRQFRHSDPVLAGEHAAVVRLHVADDGQAAAVPNAVQRAVEHRQPPLVWKWQAEKGPLWPREKGPPSFCQFVSP